MKRSKTPPKMTDYWPESKAVVYGIFFFVAILFIVVCVGVAWGEECVCPDSVFIETNGKVWRVSDTIDGIGTFRDFASYRSAKKHYDWYCQINYIDWCEMSKKTALPFWRIYPKVKP